MTSGEALGVAGRMIERGARRLRLYRLRDGEWVVAAVIGKRGEQPVWVRELGDEAESRRRP